jgi:glyoxylase-like metal-dependent hydrolase (beta-lactamase superfamily II)
MKILVQPTGMIETNCLILADDHQQALVIDPGADANVLSELLQAHDLTVIGYPFTHGHYDHVCGIADLHETHPAPCWMHPNDLSWAFTARNQNLPWYTQPDPARLPDITPTWQTNGSFTIGSFTFETLFLPGHSPGSVGFYFPEDQVLIGGDVLFKGSMGRYDLPGGDLPTLMHSLRQLAALPPDTRVYPGHGPDTTIGEELPSNPYLMEAVRGG